jgi:integrase
MFDINDTITSDAAPPKPRRGRPPGVKMKTAADSLRPHHFSFIRMAMEFPEKSLREPWERYLAFEGGPDDERHFAARLRELVGVVRYGAGARGFSAKAELALEGLLARRRPAPQPAAVVDVASDAPRPAPAISAIPSLDEWVEQRCSDLGIDYDFQTQAEWFAEYTCEFGLDQAPAPQPATAPPPLPAKAPETSTSTEVTHTLSQRLDALNALALDLARPGALTEPLNAWLSTDLAARLAKTAVDGRVLPLLTLDNLISFVNLYHHRWWMHVPRLGQVRGDRITAWLVPLATQLGRPLKEIAQKPLHEIRLSQKHALAGRKRFGMVPLDQLAVPPELSGEDGLFRKHGVNVWEAPTDIDAIFAWMQRHAISPRTATSYGPIVERFYLWAILVKRKAMSSLKEQDLRDYRDFITKPPSDWVQERQVVRGSADWRPFRGPLTPSSRKRNFIVIALMFNAMMKAGYLRANAAESVLHEIKVPGASLNVDRSFTEAQWSFVMQRWAAEYSVHGPSFGPGEVQPFAPDSTHPDRSFQRAAVLRRTRLLLELGSTTGLRLSEFATTRRGAVKREVIDGEEVLMMDVVGKGNKHRNIVLFDDVYEMIERHHLDMDEAATSFDPDNEAPLRALHDPDRTASTPVDPAPAEPELLQLASEEDQEKKPDWSKRPLIGALRKASARWVLNSNGVKILDTESPSNADPYGAIDPSALYQSLKRFFERCADDARGQGMPEEDAQSLTAASTHWMRHFFANTALSDGIAAEVVRDMMGHASLTTTSIYVRTERRRMVAQMSMLKRRGT